MKRRTSYKPLSELTTKYKRQLVSQIIADSSNTTRIDSNSCVRPQTSNEGYFNIQDVNDTPPFENGGHLETRTDALPSNEKELNVSELFDFDNSDLAFSSLDEADILCEAFKVNPQENLKPDFSEELVDWAVKTNIKQITSTDC